MSKEYQAELGESKLEAFRKKYPNRYEDYAKRKPIWNIPGREECDHLKGGKYKPLGRKDYAVWMHTYPDGRKEIKCMICGRPWAPGDPDWKEAVDMVHMSSNKPSSSEIVFPAPTPQNPLGELVALYQDDLFARKN